MGRNSTGAWTCEEAQTIEISYLLKKGFLKEGEVRTGNLAWYRRGKETGNINILGCMIKQYYIRLRYAIPNSQTGERDLYDYKIYLTSIPSNLGKGKVWYFLCPVSGKRCRVLYSAYGYPKWKSREAYQNRLYYASQTWSKKDYANSRYWALDREIKALSKTKKHYHHLHQDKLTRHALRFQILQWKQEKWDQERWKLFLDSPFMKDSYRDLGLE